MKKKGKKRIIGKSLFNNKKRKKLLQIIVFFVIIVIVFLLVLFSFILSSKKIYEDEGVLYNSRIEGGLSYGTGYGLFCGDGIKSIYEECDDGNTINSDGCDSYCKNEGEVEIGYCGDRIIQENEKCDDGNTNNEDGCSSDCQLETGYIDGCSISKCSLDSHCSKGIVINIDSLKDKKILSYITLSNNQNTPQTILLTEGEFVSYYSVEFPEGNFYEFQANEIRQVPIRFTPIDREDGIGFSDTEISSTTVSVEISLADSEYPTHTIFYNIDIKDSLTDVLFGSLIDNSIVYSSEISLVQVSSLNKGFTSVSSVPQITEITSGDYRKQVVEYKGPVLMDFWSPTCPPCMELLNSGVLNQLAIDYLNKLKIVKVDTSNPNAVKLTNPPPEGFGVTQLPTLIIICNNKIIDRKTGIGEFKDINGLSLNLFKKWIDEKFQHPDCLKELSNPATPSIEPVVPIDPIIEPDPLPEPSDTGKIRCVLEDYRNEVDSNLELKNLLELPKTKISSTQAEKRLPGISIRSPIMIILNDKGEIVGRVIGWTQGLTGDEKINNYVQRINDIINEKCILNNPAKPSQGTTSDGTKVDGSVCVPEDKTIESASCEELCDESNTCKDKVIEKCGLDPIIKNNNGTISLRTVEYLVNNFIVNTVDLKYKDYFARKLEYERCVQAVKWTGNKYPDWSKPAIVNIKMGANLGNGAATNFIYNDADNNPSTPNEVTGWKMSIQGSLDGILYSTIPHEVTHMISATYFRSPVPRWVDEGMASSAEDCSEKNKLKKALWNFLQNRRGIAFNNMFSMTEYPQDILPLYAQGLSVVEYLLELGRRKDNEGCSSEKRLYAFVNEAMKTKDWSRAIEEYYGPEIKGAGDLQTSWLKWLRGGCLIASSN